MSLGAKEYFEESVSVGSEIIRIHRISVYPNNHRTDWYSFWFVVTGVQLTIAFDNFLYSEMCHHIDMFEYICNVVTFWTI